MEGSESCPFCVRLGDALQTAESSTAFALADGFPVSAGHTLVVPRRHVADFFDLPEDEQHDAWSLVAHVRRRLVQEVAPQGFNVGLNVGAAGGQTVARAHIHIIPRFAGDVADPRGGIRWVIPKRAAYWR